MRLHHLELAGIGPFRHRQQIDFDAVAASGLFLIEGPTGAGKTTIIDAIVFALYGVLSGADSDSGRLRSQLSGLDEPSEVTLEFSVAGVRHTITRNPAYQRAKAKGEGTTLERARQTLIVHDNVTPPMRDAAEIGRYLIERLGLTADQFRRLVVLPQGEFDTLLRATPSERYKTLARLIDDGAMERVQIELLERAKEAEQLREVAQVGLRDLAAAFCSRAGEVTDDVPEPHDLTPQIVTDIRTRLADAVGTARVVAEAASATAEAAVATAHAASTRRETAHRAILARATLDRALGDLPPRLRDVSAAELRDERTALATRRERLLPWVTWEGAEQSRAQTTVNLQATVERTEQQVRDLQAAADEIPAQRQALDSMAREAEAGAALLEQLKASATRLTDLASTAQRLQDAEATLAAAQTHETTLQRAFDEARSTTLGLREIRVDLLERRLAHSAAELAASLRAGEACPVCGSPAHPSPAHPPASGLVRDADIDDVDARLASAETVEAAARSAHDLATAERGRAASAADLLRGQLEGVDVASLPTAIAGATEAVAAAEQAAHEARRLRAAIAAIDEATAQRAQELSDAIAAAAAARTDAGAHEQRIANERVAHAEAIGPDTTATAELVAIDDQARVIDAVLAAADACASLPVAEDLDALDTAATDAAQARDVAVQHRDETQQVLTTLTAAAGALTTLAQQWTTAHEKVGAVLQQTSTAIALGDLVSARGNANLRKLTLASYAVQQRFAAVLEAASVHLEHMSSGKFGFALDEGTSGGVKAGLGIDIVDAWSGQLRDPSTLSGGETFYASLSLALGLADVVREEAGGVLLETLFVDEGFGSLDGDTLTVVLDQLDALRAQGRTVGVISHVAEMKEWVHDRVIVTPSATPGAGSTIRQSGTTSTPSR